MTVYADSFAQWIVETDGASLGNPGPAGIGVVIRNATNRRIVRQCSGYIGETTNNVAEYKAFLHALDEVLRHRWFPVVFIADSELLVRQITGQYRVRKPHLKPLYNLAREKLKQIPVWTIRSVPRNKNRAADHLARTSARKRMPLHCRDHPSDGLTESAPAGSNHASS